MSDEDSTDLTTQKRKRRSLGRGLDVLFHSTTSSTSENNSIDSSFGALKTVAITDIYPTPSQPRRKFADKELRELAQSIVDHGVLQPIILRINKTKTKSNTNKDPQYQIIAGERRWRAAQIAELTSVPAVIMDINDEEALKVSLIENIQRSALSSVEEAMALKVLLDKFNHTQETLARAVGKSRSHIANNLRILSLPKEVLHKVDENNISIGHARSLIGLDNAEAIDLINQIISKNLSVRECEKIVSSNKKKKYASIDEHIKAKNKKAEVGEIEEKLSGALGFSIKLQLNSRSKGYISLLFNNPEDLNRLIDLLLSKQKAQ